MADLRLDRITKVFPGAPRASLLDVSLPVGDGEYLAILGPSGSGKTTLLRLIAGLDSPTSGAILMDGRPIDHLPPHRRGMAMVFQDQPPYPHLDVYENLAFSAKAARLPAKEVRERVFEIAGAFGLMDLLHRKPQGLSGGEIRRVVLGRAVAKRPRFLLLDEPLTGLDAPRRAAMRSLLATWPRRYGITVLLVTHDQREALALGDRVAVLHQGQVLQYGSPSDVYERPESLEVASFIGEPPINRISARWVHSENRLALSILGLERTLAETAADHENGSSGVPPPIVGIRPEHLTFHQVANGAVDVRNGVVRHIERDGPQFLVEIAWREQSLWSRTGTLEAIAPGDMVRLMPDLDRAVWFHADSGRRMAAPSFPDGSSWSPER